jgi:restriction system protein
VRDLFGTLGHEVAQKAYLITTGSFTSQAKAWAEGKPIVLFDGEALVKLIQRTQLRKSQLGR